MSNRVYIKLAVNMDVSETALEIANEKITDYIIKNKLYGASYSILRVPSQTMGRCVFLQNYIHAGLEISPTYAPDEWSLERRIFDDEETVIIVHSDGA